MRLLRLNITCALLWLAHRAFPGQTEHGPLEQRWTCTAISRASHAHAREARS